MAQYRFCRPVIGLTSSRAIFNGTIQHQLSYCKQLEPQVPELLANSLCVQIMRMRFICLRRERESCKKRVSTFANGTPTRILNQRIYNEEQQDELKA